MKKVTIFSALLLTMVLAGCSSKPDATHVANKSISAAKNVKSSQATIETFGNNSGEKISGTIDGKFHSDPDIVSVTQKTNGKYLGKYYISGKTMYVTNGKKWYKQTGKTTTQTKESVLNQMALTQPTKALKSIKSHVKVKSEKSNYVLSYSGKGKVASKAVKQILKNQMGSSVPSAAVDQLLESVKVNHFTFKYVVNKKTYLPTSSVIKLKYSDTKSKATSENTVKGKYSDINKVKEFQIPANVQKNAKSVKSSK